MPLEPILLILDLDETLVHATANRLAAVPDFKVFHYFVYKRPGLEEFLRRMAAHFQLAVWSSASDDSEQTDGPATPPTRRKKPARKKTPRP